MGSLLCWIFFCYYTLMDFFILSCISIGADKAGVPKVFEMWAKFIAHMRARAKCKKWNNFISIYNAKKYIYSITKKFFNFNFRHFFRVCHFNIKEK